MTWLDTVTDNDLGAILALRPDLASKYRAFLDAQESGAVLPPRVLALCRARVAIIHGLEPGENLPGEDVAALARGDFAPFPAAEQAALQVADKIPFRPHQLEDGEVADLATHFGADGCVSLLTAVAFHDVNTRLTLSLGVAGN